jgi:peptidylprolyl isomerase
MTRLRTLSLATVVASSLALAACGSSTPKSATGSSGGAATTSSTTTTSSTPESSTSTTAGTAAAITPVPAGDLSPAGTSGVAPTVTVPSGTPPTGLESADLIPGSGAAAASGDSVTVQYVLATYSSDKVIQSSWSSQPFMFTLDANPEQVIPGWDKGVVGMKVGGRRELVIPPSLGYGPTSPGAGISANDTLVFVVDLLKIG